MEIMKRKNYKLRYIISMLSLIIVGIFFVLLSVLIENLFWQTILNNIASALFITGVFGLINEYLLKESLVELILSKLRLKESIEKTGVEMVFSNLAEIDYDYFLKKGKSNIDIYHIYGRTWTNTHRDEIREKLIRSNCKIRVLLLSPDSMFLPALADDYDISVETLKERIYEVEDTWRKMYSEKLKTNKRKTQSTLELYYTKGKPFYSLYRIDDRIINVTSSISKEKSKAVPSLVCKNTFKNNDLFDFYKNEIEKVISESEKVDFN